MRYVPNKQDIQRIKEAAAREAVPRLSVGAVLLEPGERVGPKGSNINVLLVTDDPDWNDTDLDDYGQWSKFRKGIELTPAGRGIVDFYIRRRGDEYAEIHGNITVEIVDGKLARIYGYGNTSDYFNVKEEA